jgi:hypothetical protein
MNKFKLNVNLFLLLMIILILSVPFSTVFVAFNNKVITLKTIDIQWPPSHYTTENHSSFSFSITFEISNYGSRKKITTPNSCLLNPHVILNLENFYREYEGSICLCVVTTHAINPGATNRSIGISFEMLNYNVSTPPDGNISVWADLASKTHPYEVIRYISTLYYFENGTHYLQTSPLDNWIQKTPIDFYPSITISLILMVSVFSYKRKKS